jgi:hypothetical protein
MNAVSVDKQRNGRVVAPERQTGLEVVLLKRTYVFPGASFSLRRAVKTKSGRFSPLMT